MINNIPTFFRKMVIDHYNHTIEYYHKDPETNELQMAYYKEPVEQTIITDIFTVVFFYYLLHNL